MDGKKALIGMSGGVDSSVAALLMLRAGYECIGATMRLYDNDMIGLEKGHTCCSLDDVEDARSVARRLGIPHYVFNFKDDFERQVIQKFVSCYECGGTPNPCIDCNKYMKFRHLLDWAEEHGMEYVVTGHYARVEQDAATGRWLLKKGLDEGKDQSYVLYQLTQYQLSHLLLPVGDFDKPTIRDNAREAGLLNADKSDSQDICFVPDGDYVSFLRGQGVALEPGDFVDEAGNVLGRHRGLSCYTIGQGKGLGISVGKHVYVLAKHEADNTVVLGDNDRLFRRELTACRVNWIAGEAPAAAFRCTAKTRYSQVEALALAEPLPEGRMRLTFDEPQRAITPGQAAVLYDDDEVLGGGTIE